MTKKKFYFAEGREEENCFTMDFWKDYMRDEEIREMTLLRTETEKVDGYFWCKKDQEMYEKEIGACGLDWCRNYNPRNGRSGICKHSRNTFYTPTDKKIVLKRNGDKFKIEKL